MEMDMALGEGEGETLIIHNDIAVHEVRNEKKKKTLTTTEMINNDISSEIRWLCGTPIFISLDISEIIICGQCMCLEKKNDFKMIN